MPDIITLQAGPLSYIKSTTNKIAYLLKWYFNNPGNISDHHELEMISFREDMGNYGEDYEMLANEVRSNLGNAVRRVCPDETIIVEVTKKELDGVYYTLQILFKDANSSSILLNSDIAVKDNDIKINIKE